MELEGVLRGNHEKGVWEPVRAVLEGHHPLTHGFQKGSLCFRIGPVDLVCQDDVGEYRSCIEREGITFVGVDAVTEKVLGEHVAGELNSLEFSRNTSGECLSEGCFSPAGSVLYEDVTAREEGSENQIYDFLLPVYYPCQICPQRLYFFMNIHHTPRKFYHRGSPVAFLKKLAAWGNERPVQIGKSLILTGRTFKRIIYVNRE